MSIVISGGNFDNKGAQAMLFIAVNECEKRFPGESYILQLPKGFYTVHSVAELEELDRHHSADNVKQSKILQMIKKYRQADVMIDISGYELSSKLGLYPCLRYLFKIALSKWCGVKVYLMPQSFGPFEFKGIEKVLMTCLIKKYMSYPSICFAREKEGMEALKTIAPNVNVVPSNDLVLQNKAIESFLTLISADSIISDLKTPCVALIPNGRLSEQCGREKSFACYKEAIEIGIANGYTVYLLSHSNGDLNLCKEIKDDYKNEQNVVIVDKVLSCFEYQAVVKRFDFIIAGRYHSIVHAYKECIPAIALGWASKYVELLKIFKQENFAINVKNYESGVVSELFSRMEEMHNFYSKEIQEKLNEVQKNCCFDEVSK